MWPLLLAGAGLGVLNNMQKQQQASNQRKAQAEIQKWSPWTGLQGQTVQDPNLLGDVFTGASVGALANGMFPKEAATAAAPAAADSMGKAAQGAGGSYTPQFNFSGAQPSWLQMLKQQQAPTLYSLNQ